MGPRGARCARPGPWDGSRRGCGGVSASWGRASCSTWWRRTRPLQPHRVRELLRQVTPLRLEARRPQTFGILVGAIERRACRAELARFHGETELSLLRGVLIGATWAASLVGKQRMRPTLACPYRSAQVTEVERHILRHRACWVPEGGAWLPWLQVATGSLLALSAIIDDWPACMQHACPIPS